MFPKVVKPSGSNNFDAILWQGQMGKVITHHFFYFHFFICLNWQTRPGLTDGQRGWRQRPQQMKASLRPDDDENDDNYEDEDEDDDNDNDDESYPVMKVI